MVSRNILFFSSTLTSSKSLQSYLAIVAIGRKMSTNRKS